MKTIPQKPVTLFLLLLLAACGTDFTITTKIHRDGSCERIMVARLDSSELKENPFFIPIDSSWAKTTGMEFDSAENKTIAVVTVRKKYSSVEDMHREFHRKDSITEVQNLSMRLKRKFRWFYTICRYEETYAQQFPFHYFPVTDYFSDEEIKVYIFEDPAADSVYFSGKDSTERADIENKFEKKIENYMRDNILEEFYIELERTSRISGHEFFTASTVSEEKARILDEFRSCTDQPGRDCPEDSTAYPMLARLDSLYMTDAFTSLAMADSLAFMAFNRKLGTDFFAPVNEDYEHVVIMPGTLVNTNAFTINEGNPNWSFDLAQYVYCDFTMWAESRCTNRWAYILTIILILMAGAMGMVRRRKR